MFTEVVDRYLRLVEFGKDGYPTLIRLPAYRFADGPVIPRHGFRSRPPVGARLQDVLGMFEAGESTSDCGEPRWASAPPGIVNDPDDWSREVQNPCYSMDLLAPAEHLTTPHRGLSLAKG